MASDQVRPPVLIFVHGLYGCNLARRDSSSRAWLSARTILRACCCRCNKGHTPLALPISWNAAGTVQDADALEPAGPLEKGYAQLLRWMERRRSAGGEVHSFCWDWRRALEESEYRLCAFLAGLDLGGGPGQRRAVLVTHSTGSLLAWPSVSRHPEFFDAWVTVGGALGGGTTTLKDLARGWKAGAVRLLSPETNFTFAAMYGFFPVREPELESTDADADADGCSGGGHTGALDVAAGAPVEFDLFDHAEWEMHTLGLYAHRARANPKAPKNALLVDDEVAHLRNALAAGQRFRLAHFVVGTGATDRAAAAASVAAAAVVDAAAAAVVDADGSDGGADDADAFLARPRCEYEHLQIVAYGSDAHATQRAWEYQWDGGQMRRASGSINQQPMGAGRLRADLPAAVTRPGDGTIRSANWRKVPGRLEFTTVTSGTGHAALCDDHALHALLGDLLAGKSARAAASSAKASATDSTVVAGGGEPV